MSDQVAAYEVDSTVIAAGTTLVEASAGTGKTFNIALTVLRLLLERKENGEPLVDGLPNILVVTFTRAATEELVTRIRNVLQLTKAVLMGEPYSERQSAEARLIRKIADGRERFALERVEAARSTLDMLAVSTIHGFCKRALEEYALESGATFGLDFIDDTRDLTDQAAADWFRNTFYEGPHTDLLSSLALIEKWGPSTFVEMYNTWQRWPDTRLEPEAALSDKIKDIEKEAAVLASLWSKDEVTERAASMRWKADATLDSAEHIDLLDAMMEWVRNGNLALVPHIVSRLSLSAVQAQAGARSKADKQAKEALASWELLLSAERLDTALRSCEAALRNDALRTIDLLVAEAKREQAVAGFDDLLKQLRGVLHEQGEDGHLAKAIRGRSQAALIDEFQDTDGYQYDIFRLAFHGCPLFLIGDPKQAIYAFRGADVRAYLRAAENTDRRYTLYHNYRSTPYMVNAANALFSRSVDPFVNKEIGFVPAVAREHPALPVALKRRTAIQWFFVPPVQQTEKLSFSSKSAAARLLMRACADRIVEYINEGVDAESMAVLVRTGREGAEMVRLLSAAGVPAVLSGIDDVMHSEQMKDIERLLIALLSPRNVEVLRASMATELWGANYDDIRRIKSSGGESDWEQALSELNALHSLWHQRGIRPAIEQVLSMRDVVARWLKFVDGDRRLTNLRHCIELLHEAEHEESLGPEELLEWLRRTRRSSMQRGGVRELRLESDDKAVRVMTVHASKGLQFDLVFCPTLWASRSLDSKGFVLVHEDDGSVFDHGSDMINTRRAIAESERLAEDCRLVYVAVTRARFQTCIGWGPIGHAGGGGSEYSGLSWLLFEPPQDKPDMGPAEAQEYLRANPETWQEMLYSLARAHPDLMSVELVDEMREIRKREPVKDGGTAATAGAVIAARSLPPSPSPWKRFSSLSRASFTSLSSHSSARFEGDSENADISARDVGDEYSVSTELIATEQEKPDDFRIFPAGARPGVVLHALFERSAFDASNEQLLQLASDGLTALPLTESERAAHTSSVVAMMARTLREPIGSLGFALNEVPNSKTLREWQFLLPLASADQPLAPGRLAECFRNHGAERARAYANKLATLSFKQVHGFLTGFVDLLFEHKGLWYVVDWKSNQLGFSQDNYTETALELAMQESHYTLQYHLYLVAVHRFLRTRLPNYNIETQLGGAAYAFLRGKSAGVGAGRGWYLDRPPAQLILALSDLFDPGR